jgi:hypothetical protein
MARERKYEIGAEVIDWERYAAQEPNNLHRHFANWLVKGLDLEFKTKVSADAFLAGVQYAVALRMPYQRSPENHQRREEERQAREEELAELQGQKAARAASRKPAKLSAVPEVNGDAPRKRGPGRPRKTEAEVTPVPAKRGPGRPRKGTAPMATGDGAAPAVKRGPGRPPKKSPVPADAVTPKRPPRKGRPVAVTADAEADF